MTTSAAPLVEFQSIPVASHDASRPTNLESSGDAGDQLTFKVYKPSSASSAPPPLLPDEYFNPTAADLKAAQATLASRTQALVDAPLELRSVREAREQGKRDRWPNTTIRVKFTDRTQLEHTFPSTDKIRSVYAFVRNALRDDVKPIKFILCTPVIV
ncbi:hypothetical protein H0H87_001162 [Tephrocybe sp. NHM501043]|nr:hypothetical protein H0H87_001162 [Tephrocybe sp. NHM501043]